MEAALLKCSAEIAVHFLETRANSGIRHVCNDGRSAAKTLAETSEKGRRIHMQHDVLLGRINETCIKGLVSKRFEFGKESVRLCYVLKRVFDAVKWW